MELHHGPCSFRKGVVVSNRATGDSNNISAFFFTSDIRSSKQAQVFLVWGSSMGNKEGQVLVVSSPAPPRRKSLFSLFCKLFLALFFTRFSEVLLCFLKFLVGFSQSPYKCFEHVSLVGFIEHPMITESNGSTFPHPYFSSYPSSKEFRVLSGLLMNLWSCSIVIGQSSVTGWGLHLNWDFPSQQAVC